MTAAVRSVREWTDLIASEIAAAAERPRREAELMLMEHLGCDPVWLITHPDAEVRDPAGFEKWVQRRKAHEPLEYIFNRVSFYSRAFFVAPGALIPRPETELLIDAVLERVAADTEATLCEVGVGSGALSVVLAEELPKMKMIGVDISDAALGVASKNIEAYALDSRIELRHSDLLQNVPESIDILVSNPPYVAQDAALEKNLDYEPDRALFAGTTGMDVISRLIRITVERAIPLFCCEMGYDQREAVTALQPEDYDIEFYKDLAGLDRGFIMRRRER